MTSARKKAAETMALTDVVIEVCDARLPEASSNPMIRELRLHRQRPCLKLLEQVRPRRPRGDAGLARLLQQPARRQGGGDFEQEAGRGGARAQPVQKHWRRIAMTASSRCAC
jgi:hypothetical protein